MAKFHMDLTPESAGKLLRDMAERTASASRNWDNFEALATQLVGDAYNAGRDSVAPGEAGLSARGGSADEAVSPSGDEPAPPSSVIDPLPGDGK